MFTKNSFSDVTLVSDDKIQFEAHKCVLSASSPVLKKLLLNNPHPHPLIYLKGVKQQELQSILQFIYLGEARFYQGNMDRFMEAVKDLQIKQLAECFETAGNPFINREEHADEDEHILNATSDPDIPININEEIENNSRSISSTVDEILRLDIRTYNSVGESGSRLYKCEECEAVFKSCSGLIYHTSSKHEGVVYSCNKCEYKATQQGNLNTHQRSKHEGETYSCKQCEYQTTWNASLRIHQHLGDYVFRSHNLNNKATSLN